MCLPHTRGDEPSVVQTYLDGVKVCPTRVGMNRSRLSTTCCLSSVRPTRVGMNRRPLEP